MLRHALLVALTLLVGLGACGNDPGKAPADAATDAAADATAGDAFQPGPDAGRNPACGPFDDNEYGKKKPWTSFDQGGKTYTCNTCRGGYPNLVGTWRFIDFETEDPATPLKDGYKETLTFDGNAFSNRLAGLDAGKPTDATIEGWYWCADAAELPTKHEVFVLESVAPDGAFGNAAGDVFTVSVKVNGTDLIALGVHHGFEGPLLGEYIYCRVGSTIQGHPCDDPFTK